MNVCIDIQAGVAQRAGVGRYTHMLATHLGESADADTLNLFYFDFQRKGIPFTVWNARHRAVRWCPGRVVQRAWKTVNWPPFDWFAGPADVYHFPNFILPPLRRGRTVVTIHDASFVRYPAFAEARNLRYLQAGIYDTIRRADAIICDAEFGARELVELFGTARDRIFPIHLGISSAMVPPPEPEVAGFRGRLGLFKPYVLFVGTLEPRKNIPFLIEVFERMTAFDGELVIAGMPGWQYEPILLRMRRSSRASAIRYLNYVGEGDLPALYTEAEMLLFPSLYEGFGFPPLEAMACGTPVISSAGGSLPEVLGDGAVILDEFSAELWADKALTLMADTEEHARLTARGRQRAAMYSWPETARKTWEAYRKVAR